MARSRAPQKKKTLAPASPQGQRGIHLIGDIVGEMGSRWDTTQSTEVGLDGYIELFDPHTHQPKNVQIAVQSKTVVRFDGTDDEIRYTCRRADIDYWLSCAMPVILIVSRPATREVFWIDVKSYFTDPEHVGTTVVRIDRRTHRFTVRSYDALLEVGRPSDRSLVRSPVLSPEALYCNLIPLRSFPKTIFIAPARQPTRGHAWAQLRHSRMPVPRPWTIHGDQFIGFVTPEMPPFDRVVDNAVEENDSVLWAYCEDPSARRVFAELLKYALREDLATLDIAYFERDSVFAFRGNTTAERTLRYRNVNQWSTMTVVHHYPDRNNNNFLVLRHLAMESKFRFLGGKWFLEITPTYRFTTDGVMKFRFHEERLSKIKRIEKNRAVLRQVMAWADCLNPTELFDGSRRWLEFERVPTFLIDESVPDDDWLSPVDDEEEEEQGLDLLEGVAP
jgi:hypothetical protein